MLAHHFSHYYNWRCRQMVSLSTTLFPCSWVGSVAILVATWSETQSHLDQNSCPHHTKLSVQFEPWICWGFSWEIDVGSPLFTLLQLDMPTNGVTIFNTISMLPGGQRCDIGCDLVRNSIPPRSKFMPSSHQTFCPVWAIKLLGILLRNRCWLTTFHIITSEDANKWCCYLQHYFHVPGWAALRYWLRPGPKLNPTSIKIHAPTTPNFLSSSSH